MPQSPEEKQKSATNAYAKYGGMAIQFLGACLLGVMLGKWLDAKMQLERPFGAVFLTVGFMVAAMYSVYRQLLNDK